jgi:hypothetical protein
MALSADWPSSSSSSFGGDFSRHACSEAVHSACTKEAFLGTVGVRGAHVV